MKAKELKNFYQFDIQVRLGEFTPDDVRVELYANAIDGQTPFHQALVCNGKLNSGESIFLYSAQLPAGRPIADYTPRIIPNHLGVLVPAEAEEILWQH